MAIMFLYLNLL